MRVLVVEDHAKMAELIARGLGEDGHLGGLNAGADNYLTKPFAPRELFARLRAVRLL